MKMLKHYLIYHLRYTHIPISTIFWRKSTTMRLILNHFSIVSSSAIWWHYSSICANSAQLLCQNHMSLWVPGFRLSYSIPSFLFRYFMVELSFLTDQVPVPNQYIIQDWPISSRLRRSFQRNDSSSILFIIAW